MMSTLTDKTFIDLFKRNLKTSQEWLNISTLKQVFTTKKVSTSDPQFRTDLNQFHLYLFPVVGGELKWKQHKIGLFTHSQTR